MPSPTRIFDLLDIASTRPRDQVMFSSVSNGQWRDYTCGDYIAFANSTSYALIEHGIKKGDPVVSITHNRAEFNFVDMGIMQIGAVHVPLYPAIDTLKLEKILQETGAHIAFVSNRSVLRKIRQVKSSKLKMVVSFDTTEGAIPYQEFLKKTVPVADTLQRRKEAVQPDDPASITYLSGSNTPLRGVVLSHAAHIFNLLSYCQKNHFAACRQSVSFLPLAHSFERTVNYSFQYLGINICYSEGLGPLPGILKKTKPDVLLVVPLVLERIVETFVNELLKTEGLQGYIAQFALRKAKLESPKKGKSIFSWKQSYYRKLFASLRNFLGGNLKVVLCGGAALKKETLNILWAAGVPVFEGYGLTEAGPLVAYNLQESFKAYTVGRPMTGVEVRIAPDGEVLVNSGGLMTAYFKQDYSPVDADGWLHTGDMGELDEKGFITLTGTKKEIFKLSSGLYTDPRPIEALLSVSPYIYKVWVYGHNRPFLVAFICSTAPMEGAVHNQDQPYQTTDDTKQAIEREISTYNNACPKYDQIIRFEIVADEWTTTNGLLTPDGNVDRQALLSKYGVLIDEFYKE